MWAGLTLAATGAPTTGAQAEALLVIEAESGRVLYAHNAAHPWYPASITKLMTAYVTLREVREGRITLDTPLKVSANAASQNPVKMGFRPGITVTVDNALKMLMVKSANDIAVVLAEGVAGSVENFADLMNRHARRLGMTQSTFVNPNGLPADDQVSSARDIALLARTVIREMPEYDHYWSLPGIRMGKMVQRNYNTLIGRYPGADGMKTGFICASGFNLVASATRDGKRMIAVVLGAPSSAARAMKAAQLLERGFNGSGSLSWLMPSLGTVDSLQPVEAAPPNLRDEMCGGHRKRPATEDEDEHIAANTGPDSPYAVFLSSLRPKSNGGPLLHDLNAGQPVLVFTGTKPPAPGSAIAEATSTAEKKKKDRGSLDHIVRKTEGSVARGIGQAGAARCRCEAQAGSNRNRRRRCRSTDQAGATCSRREAEAGSSSSRDSRCRSIGPGRRHPPPPRSRSRLRPQPPPARPAPAKPAQPAAGEAEAGSDSSRRRRCRGTETQAQEARAEAGACRDDDDPADLAGAMTAGAGAQPSAPRFFDITGSVQCPVSWPPRSALLAGLVAVPARSAASCRSAPCHLPPAARCFARDRARVAAAGRTEHCHGIVRSAEGGGGHSRRRPARPPDDHTDRQASDPGVSAGGVGARRQIRGGACAALGPRTLQLPGAGRSAPTAIPAGRWHDRSTRETRSA